jgi:hypothetical protein
MLLALISLGCITFVGSLIGDSDYEEKDALGNEDIDLSSEKSEDINENDNVSSDIFGDLLYEYFGEVDGDDEMLVSVEELSPESTPIVDRIVLGQVSEPSDYDESVSEIYSKTTDAGIPPLNDWVLDSKLEVVNLADVDAVFVEKPTQPGTLMVVQADYYEKLPFSDGDMLHNIHSGANVYFIPKGEEFPEKYEWSESSATLYNTSTYINQADDFGGIKHIHRYRLFIC